jgi:hypothetical protein
MPAEIKIDIEVEELHGWKWAITWLIALFSKEQAIAFAMSVLRYRLDGGEWKRLNA